MTTNITELELRNKIANALSKAGSCCGECGFEPGDRGQCTDCERHWTWCADELLPLLQAEHAAGLAAAADELQAYIDTEWSGPDRKEARRLWWQPRIDSIRSRADAA